MNEGSVSNLKNVANKPQHSPYLSFKLPLPPSMNDLYGINYRTKQVYMNNDARYWKTKAKLCIPYWNCTNTDKLQMTLSFKSEWHCKNGAIKKKDVHNLIKVVVDAIAERCGFDDSQVFSFSANKVESSANEVTVQMGVLNETVSEGVEGKAEESIGG